jgi:curved DNA-binding protein CbpA
MSNRWPPGWRDQDYYAIIGVPSTASTEQITQAYHQLARTTHPDTDPEHPDADRFRLLADAHAVLADPVSRAAYDHARSAISPRAATSRSDCWPTRTLGAIAFGSHRPRPAGATALPGPVRWTSAPTPARRREQW